MLKKILIGAGALVGLLVVAVIAFIVFFPKQAAVAEVERRIEASTERDLTLGGDIELSFWPALGFSARQASLSNPHGFGDAPFLAADRIVFAIAVMPLLSGHIEVKQLILEGADLRLEAKRDGTTNWTFPTDESKPNSLSDLRIEEMRLAHGRITYQAPDGAPPMTFENVDGSLSLDSLDKPSDLQSAFDYRGQRVNVTAHIALPRAVLEKGRTPMKLDARTTTLSASFDGAFNALDGGLQGRVTAEGTSLRNLMGWLGSPMAEGGGFGTYRVEADLTQAGPRTSLVNSVLRLDDIVLRGPIEILQQANGKLKVSGTLNAPSIDLNPYLPAPPQGAGGGVAANAAWSNEPLDLTGLRSIDAELAFATPSLRFQNLSFTDAQMSLRIANGAADARLTRVALYSGTGTARLIADGSGATPRIAVELNADNIQAQPFLRDAIAFDKVEGRGRVTAALAGQGRSQEAIMRSLHGTSSFRFNDGAWHGVNLGAIARFVNSARTGEAMGANSSTDFAEFSSTFTVTNGVAATDNLKMLSPYVRLDGTGLVNIGAQTLDMRLSPRAVNTAQGQGSTEGATGGLGIPFTATGPWAHPSFRPAIGDAIAARARDALRGGDSSNPLNALGNAIFGARAPTPSTATTSTTAPTTSTTTSTTTTTTTTTTRNPLEDIFRRN